MDADALLNAVAILLSYIDNCILYMLIFSHYVNFNMMNSGQPILLTKWCDDYR